MRSHAERLDLVTAVTAVLNDARCDRSECLVILGTAMSVIVATAPAEKRPLLIGEIKQCLDVADAMATQTETGAH